MIHSSKLDPYNTRVILHIDLDCFYAQVEQRRLNIPREVPVAVQQWDGLIAVNYPARAKGITRHMRVAEAKSKCPELVLVHVETIGTSSSREDNAVERHSTVDNADGQGEDFKGAEARTPFPNSNSSSSTSRLTQKACLERYRRANAEILEILHRLASTATIEKASIDEVYMDVTAMVDAELRHPQADTDDGGHKNIESTSAGFAWGGVVVGGPLDPGSEFDVRLAAGAGIACRLRGAIRTELGFTASAGIAANKLLAKIGSAMNKPDQMTVIPPRAVTDLMKDLPLKKLRNFGGKLGALLEGMGCTTVGDVVALPCETLEKAFGSERARWIAQAVRGQNNDPVEERERPKSMLAAKSFNATSELAALRRWIGILAAELAPRMAADEAAFKRRPKTLVVHFRRGAAGNTYSASSSTVIGERSRQAAMPRMPPPGTPCAETIANAAWSIFQTRCAMDALPCTRLALSAVDFLELPAGGGVKGSITKFLVPQNDITVSLPPAENSFTSESSAVPEMGKAGGGAPAVAVNKKEERVLRGKETTKLPGLESQKNTAGSDSKRQKADGQQDGAPAHDSAPDAIDPETAHLLKGIDIAEQGRLLKEATMLN